MSLDLGQLIAVATIEDVQFQRTYVRLVGQLSDFGTKAGAAAGGTEKLDESLAGLGTTAGKASESLSRSAAAEQKAAAAAKQHADATATVNRVMAESAGITDREAQQVLRLTAAQDRLDAVQKSGTATTRQLASAQSSLIGAQRGLSAAQEEGAAASSKMRDALAGTVRTAGELGVIVGALEAVKGAIDITKDANSYQASMTRVKTLTGATQAEVDAMSKSLLGLSGRVAQSPDDLATAFYHAASVGLKGADALGAVTAAAKGAKIGGADLEETMNALTSTVASGIAKNQSYSTTMSELLTIVGTGDMKLSDFNDSLSSGLLANMTLYGVSLKDVGAAIATFGDNNIRGAKAATDLRLAVQSLASPAKLGYGELAKLGLSATDLAKDLQQGGLNQAITDLRSHLHSAGIEGNQTGAIITDIFGKKAGVGLGVLLENYDRLQSKYAMLDKGAETFGQRWADTTKTASFALSRLGDEAEAAGISFEAKLTPELAKAVTVIANDLPKALSDLQHILGPTEHEVGVVFVAAWRAVSAVVKVAAGALEEINHFLGGHVQAVTAVTTAVLSMWGAFKLYTIVTAAWRAISTGFATMRAEAAGGLTAMRAWGTGVNATLSGVGTEAGATSLIMQAEFAKIAEAALAEAAVIDKAKAREAAAFADTAAASKASTDAQVTAAEEASAAAQAQARASVAAAAEISAAADAAAADVTAAGDVAAVGWKSILGPVALVATAVTALVAVFHHGNTATQEVNASTQAYLGTLQQTKGAINAVVVAQVTQKLASDGVYDAARKYGISMSTVTQAVLGNRSAVDSLTRSVGGNIDAFNKVLAPVFRQGTALQDASHQHKQATEASKEAAATSKSLANQMGVSSSATIADTHSIEQHSSATRTEIQTTKTAAETLAQHAAKLGLTVTEYKAVMAAAASSAQQTREQTVEWQQANDAADLLGQTLDKLNGNKVGYAQADNSFESSLVSMAENLAKGSKSIRGLSSDAIANRGDLIGLVTSAQDTAKAYGEMTGSTEKGRQKLIELRAQIIANAVAHGEDKKAVTAYIDSLLKIPLFVPPTKIDVETATPERKIKQLRTDISLIRQGDVPSLDVNTEAAARKIADLQILINELAGKATSADTAATAADAGHRNDGTGSKAAAAPAASGGGHGSSTLSVDARNAAQAKPPKPGIVTVPPTSKSSSGSGSGSSSSSGGSSSSKKKKAPVNINVGGTDYASTRAAGNAEERLLITVNSTDLDKLQKALAGTGADASGALKDLENDLGKAGFAPSFIRGLKSENAQILLQVKERNQTAKLLAKANTELQNTRKARAAEIATVKGAVTGSFDITSAGASPITGKITGKGILAEEKQDVEKAKLFVKDLEHLAPYIGKSYLTQLAEKGPDALPEAEALMSLSKSQLHLLRVGQSQLAGSGTTLGTLVGNKDFNSKIDAEVTEVKQLRKDEKAENKALRADLRMVGDQITYALEHLHLKGDIKLTAAQWALIVHAAQKTNPRGKPK